MLTPTVTEIRPGTFVNADKTRRPSQVRLVREPLLRGRDVDPNGDRPVGIIGNA